MTEIVFGKPCTNGQDAERKLTRYGQIGTFEHLNFAYRYERDEREHLQVKLRVVDTKGRTRKW